MSLRHHTSQHQPDQPLLADRQVVILGCSNGRPLTSDARHRLEVWVQLLRQDYGARVTVAPTVFQDSETGTHYRGDQRAQVLRKALANPAVDLILDPTGGDLANECLVHLSPAFLQTLGRSKPVVYMGYSDNSVMLNACLASPQIVPVNFNPLAIVDDAQSRAHFDDWLRQPVGQATLGGNLRCFLKLAGTAHWPTDTQGRVLYLEASSGSLERVRSLLTQLSQVLDLESLDGLVLGQFNEIDDRGQRSLLVDYLSQLTTQSIRQELGLGHRQPLKPLAYQPINNKDGLFY